MATNVIKRDGSQQPFDEAKIKRSIEAACEDAGVDEAKTVEVISQVLPAVLEVAALKEEIATSELSDAVLTGLETAESAAAEAWRKHVEGKAV